MHRELADDSMFFGQAVSYFHWSPMHREFADDGMVDVETIYGGFTLVQLQADTKTIWKTF